ncbi:hypothetical protein GJ496_000314 [Pomphorhynchus laevis]|nr:hypothetical protein GJ496_000314 [Pomphorhynchus laevis]
MTRRRSRKNHSSDSDAISSRKSSAKISMGFRVNVSMTTSENRHFQLAPPPKPLPPLSNRSKRNSYNKSIRLNKLEPPPSLPPSIFGPNGSSLLRYGSPHVLNRHHQRRRINNDCRRGRRYSSNSYELIDSRRHSTMNPSYKMPYQPPNITSQIPSGTQYAHVPFKSQNQQFWPHPTAAAAYPLPTGYNLSNATPKHIVGNSSCATKSSIKERKVINSKSKKSRKRSCSTCSTYSSSSCSVSSTCSTCCSRQSSSRSASSISSDRSYRRHRRHRKAKVQKPRRRRATVKKRKQRNSKKRHTRTKAKRRQLTESSICSESESNHTPTIASSAASCGGIMEEETDDKQKQPQSEDESYTAKSDDASVADTNKQIEYDDDEDLRDLAEKKRILLEQIAQLDAQLGSPTEVDEYCDNQATNSTEIIE